MARDYIEEAGEIASKLRQEGLVELAESINDAIDYSSTGTEILMKLRFYLNKCIEKETYNDKNMIPIILELHDYINKLLIR